ncbi:hypothetical protein [Nocardia sp. NPDC005366]|uniref:hypothetical protein n=1 Tax=Nocardia sp. NPDC005366 TaxID=3156878 RepID=UPI0033B8385A
MPDHTDTSRFSALPARPEVPWLPRARQNPWQQSTASQTLTAEKQSVSISVSDVLDYFEKCPSCGYPAQATATVRRFENGHVETSIHPTCGLPCGWHGTVQVTTKPAVRVDPKPAVTPVESTARLESGARAGKAEPGIRGHSPLRAGWTMTPPRAAIS